MYDYPLAHPRVEVLSPTGSAEVVVLLRGGIRFTAWDDYRDLHAFGISSQRSRARAIGLFIDFVHAVGHEFYDKSKRYLLLLRFTEALTLGTIKNGKDATNLWWLPRSHRQVQLALNEVTDFSKWLSKQQGRKPLNPIRRASPAEQIVFWHRWNKRTARSLLAHARSRRRHFREAIFTTSVQVRRRSPIAQESPKAFPEDAFPRLIREGFRRSSVHAWTTLRDQLLVTLMHGGGVRVSEPLHMWLGDVYEDPSNRDLPVVRIYHPSEGVTEVLNPETKRNEHLMRSEILRLRYDRRPLTEMLGSRHVGWKNPLLTDRLGKYFVVFWRSSIYARLFMALYRAYLRSRPRVSTHPYLFIASSGAPLTVKGVEKVHAAAVRRIGLVPSRNLGTTPHGHRHAFGHALEEAKVSRKAIQVAMHHVSPLSQDVYKDSDLSRVRKAVMDSSSVADSLLEICS